MTTITKELQLNNSITLFNVSCIVLLMVFILTGTSLFAQNKTINDFYIAKNGDNVMIHAILKNKTSPYIVYLEKLNSSGRYVSISHKTGILSDWDVNYYFTDKLSNIDDNIYRIKLVEDGQLIVYSAVKTIELLNVENIESTANLADNNQ
jgi:hypothetical protein